MINSHAHKILPLFRNKVGVDSDILSVLDHSSQKSVFKGNQIPWQWMSRKKPKMTLIELFNEKNLDVRYLNVI